MMTGELTWNYNVVKEALMNVSLAFGALETWCFG